MYGKHKIEDIITLMGEVSNLFYQHKLQEGYQELEQLLGLLSITMNELYAEKILSLDDTSILDILKEIMGAMEGKDTLLVADILEYDLKECLLRLKDSI